MLAKTSLSIAAVIALSSLGAFAADFQLTPDVECTPIRIDKPPSPLAKIKQYDMDGLNMCTAYSTSYLTDAERLLANPNTKHFTSPLFIGIQYAKSKNQTTLEVRDNLGIPSKINELKSCSYDVVSDKILNQNNGQFLTTLLKDFKEKNSSGVLNCFLNSGISAAKNIKDISAYLNTDNFVDFSSNVFGDICSDSMQDLSQLPEVKTDAAYKYPTRNAALNSFRKKFNDNLRNGRPTGVNYCQLVLSNPMINGIDKNGFLSEKNCKVGNDIVGHSSSIVGRRLLKYKDGNVTKAICQYLIRDVYGSSCSKYPPDPNANPTDICEDGSVWLDEDAILMNTNEIFNF